MRSRSANWIRVGATAFALILLLEGGSSVRAVQDTRPPGTPTPVQAPAQGQAPERLTLAVGRSLPIDLTYDMERLSITDPDVADAIPVTQREILVHGKRAGTVSLFVWGPGGRRTEYELVVNPGTTSLQTRMAALFPGEEIQVDITQGAIILSGRVSSNAIMLRAAEVAGGSAPDQKLINMLQVPGGGGSQQVMLQVRFAEVNSRAVRELGVSLFSSRTGFTARSTTQQFPAPNFDSQANAGSNAIQGLVFADYLNLFFFQRNQGIGAVVKALEQNGWFESLAEPNLIAYNGQEASFLAGGEFPIYAVGGNGSANISYKEYGVKLKFRPTIAGDVIRLHVRPEVSALDFANGISAAGVRIPALTSRYAETEIELRDGQSFAIAGLLDSIGQEDKQGILGLSNLPIIGAFFRSKANRTERTELMVLITPRLVRPLDPDEVPPLPTVIKPGGGRGGGGGNGSGGVSDYLQGGAGMADAPANAGRGKSGR